MSNNDLFDSDKPTDKVEMFSDEDVASDKDYVNELVGEGKKFKDANSLAKSVAFKDSHILQIEKENAELRQKIQQSLSLEEFYDKVKGSAVKSAPPSHSNPAEDEMEESLSLEQIESLVEKRYQAHRNTEIQQANLAKAVSEAERRLGPNFRKLLRDRARELGESESDLTQLAMVKPAVFVELMAPKKAENVHFPSSPHSDIDPAKMAQNPRGEVRNKSFYDKVRKEDKARYMSREVQAQMHKDAIALGEKFFQ